MNATPRKLYETAASGVFLYSMDTAGIYGNGEYSVKKIVVDVQKGITN